MEINGYENYLIYPSGKVYSKVSKIYLTISESDTGYMRVSVWKDNKIKTLKIHRLLAEHFIENPDNLKEIDHIDRNRKNNKLNNLRWVSHSQNNHNKGLRKDNKLGIANITQPPRTKIFQYKKTINGNIHIKTFRTLEDAIEYKTNYEKNM
tara:strand:+ start:126 stop:578 length:453 start_codon:yes stop_codon:yes gene_type:complete